MTVRIFLLDDHEVVRRGDGAAHHPHAPTHPHPTAPRAHSHDPPAPARGGRRGRVPVAAPALAGRGVCRAPVAPQRAVVLRRHHATRNTNLHHTINM